jgi:type I restriction enzyme S subunit
MDFTPEEREIYNLVPGDILLNEGQSLELVGRCAIFKGPLDTYCFQNTLVRFRCNGYVIPDYCQAVFKYWLDTGKFMLVAKQTTSVAHLGADRFAKMTFFRPTPDEQRRIVTKLSTQDTRIATEETYLNKLQQIKEGLMHDLLTGTVRVTPLVAAGEQ